MEQLINIVKENPIIYNCQHDDYKNIKKMERVWDAIGERLGEDGSVLKIKWRNMRDSYTKHLKTLLVPQTEAGPSKARYKRWQWAQQMEFCRPFLRVAAAEATPVPKPEQEAAEDSSTPSKASKKIRIRYPRSIVRLQSSKEKLQQQSTSAAGNESLDAVDLLFRGLAKTVKTFPAKRQALIKLRIANLVLQEEVKQQEERDGEGNVCLSKVEPETTESFSDSGILPSPSHSSEALATPLFHI